MTILAHAETVFDDVVVRVARPGEEDVVLELLAEAAAWLDGRGISQWPARFPTSSVQAQIAAGEALLVEDARGTIATLVVSDGDAELWGANTAPAYHISRLAVARQASGAQLGYRLIDWVAGKAAERGWRVRLATARDNPALRNYYERAGFVHVADPPHARWPTSLYERVGRGRRTVFSVADFDDLVGRLDYPMLVVTADDGRRRAGCLVGFASQCGIDPARFMVWLSKNNHTYQVTKGADRLGVHVLGPDNRALAELFGSVTGFDDDKFARCAWRDADGVPLLTDCPQWFVGRVLSWQDTGDHDGVLLEPTAVGEAGLGQLGFQAIRDLDPGNEA